MNIDLGSHPFRVQEAPSRYRAVNLEITLKRCEMEREYAFVWGSFKHAKMLTSLRTSSRITMNTTLPLMRCCPCFLLRRSVYSYSCAFHPVPVSSSASQPAALMLPRARFLRYSAPYHRRIFLSPYELREWLLFDERHITKSVTCSEIVDKFPPTSNPRILRVG